MHGREYLYTDRAAPTSALGCCCCFTIYISSSSWNMTIIYFPNLMSSTTIIFINGSHCPRVTDSDEVFTQYCQSHYYYTIALRLLGAGVTRLRALIELNRMSLLRTGISEASESALIPIKVCPSFDHPTLQVLISLLYD